MYVCKYAVFIKAFKECSGVKFLCSKYLYKYVIVYVYLCLYVYLWKHSGMIKHFMAMDHVPLDSNCFKVCPSFLIKSLFYSVFLALGAITEMLHTAFVGGYFVVC